MIPLEFENNFEAIMHYKACDISRSCSHIHKHTHTDKRCPVISVLMILCQIRQEATHSGEI